MRAVPTDLWIFLAGLVAGSVNGAAGGGTLLALPVLIGVAHLSPLVANTTCTVGLLPGIIASTGGYWRELSAGLRRDARRQLLPSALGGLLGAWLLLTLGGRVFARVVPWLLVVSAILIAVQPLVNRWLARHRPEHGYPAATVVVPFGVSVYGGYFGAAQGIPFLAAMGLLLPRPIGELNALRILNAMINNAVAALTFIALEALHPTGALDFHAALPLALGSVIGGWAGVRVARRLPAPAQRLGEVDVAGGAQRDPRQEQHGHREQNRSRSAQRARAEPREERLRANDQDAAGHRADGQGESRGRGSHRELPLEQQGDEEDARIEADAVQRGGCQRAGERAVAQHGQVHRRRPDAALALDEQPAEKHRGSEQPRSVRAAELQRDESRGEERRAAQVQSFLARSRLHVQVAQEQKAREAQRDVDPEDGGPTEVVRQQAPQGRSEERPQHGGDAHQRNGGAAALARVERHEDALREGQQTAGREPLQDAAGDQRRSAARGGACNGGERERPHLCDEVRPHSDAGGEAGGERHGDEARQRVPGDHPAHGGQRGPQLDLDLGDGDVDDAAVDRLQPRPEQNARAGHPFPQSFAPLPACARAHPLT